MRTSNYNSPITVVIWTNVTVFIQNTPFSGRQRSTMHFTHGAEYSITMTNLWNQHPTKSETLFRSAASWTDQNPDFHHLWGLLEMLASTSSLMNSQ